MNAGQRTAARSAAATSTSAAATRTRGRAPRVRRGGGGGPWKGVSGGCAVHVAPLVRLAQVPVISTQEPSLDLLSGGRLVVVVVPTSSPGMAPTDSLLDETVYKEVKRNGEPLRGEHSRRTPPEGPDGDEDGELLENFYTRAGRAAKVLKEDFPRVFKHAHQMDIYTPDVAFVDDVTTPGTPHVVHGVEAYQRQLWSLRLHSALFCSSIGMQVLRMWQPREKCISVRWSIKATPRLIGSLIEKPYYFDGLSEFKLNDEGKVYEHRVTRLDWDMKMFNLKAIQSSNVASVGGGGPMMPC